MTHVWLRLINIYYVCCLLCIGTNSTGKGAEIGHSDDTGGEDDSFEPREGNLRMFGPVSNGGGRQSGTFRRESQNDPSRSNSLMSENSSQADMHPFFKVYYTNIVLFKTFQTRNLVMLLKLLYTVP